MGVGTIDATELRRSPRAVQWVFGLTTAVGVVAGGFGTATMNVSRPLTIGATTVATVLLGVAGVTAVWRLPGEHPTPRRRRGVRCVGGALVVVAVGLGTLSVASGMTGWTPRGMLRDLLTGPGQLVALPLDTSPPLQAELYFGSLSAVIDSVRDAPDFAADYALARSQPDVCAAVVIANGLVASNGSIAASFTGPQWTALESVPDTDIGGLPFIRQPVLTPPAGEPAGARITVKVTIREDLVVATGSYSAELLGASGPHRLWRVGSGSGRRMVECSRYLR